MANEKIYTIKISEAMKEKCGCPLCTVEERLRKDELERILGASMMEPNVRIQTNEQGFCEKHLEKMYEMPNKLSLALMLQTHIDELNKKVYANTVPLLKKMPDGKKQAQAIEENRRKCYLCKRENEFMNATYSAFAYMFKTDSEFEGKIKEQPCFCLKHMRLIIDAAVKELGKEQFRELCDTLNEVNMKYATELSGDLDWFCKKFDYRYKDEDWKNSKDATLRAVRYLK